MSAQRANHPSAKRFIVEHQTPEKENTPRTKQV